MSALKLFLAGREIVGLRTRLEAIAVQRTTAESSENELRKQLAELDTG